MTAPAKRTKLSLSDVIEGNIRSLPKSSMNKELDGFKGDHAFQKLCLEASIVSAITEFIRQHQLCMPSFLTAVWTVLHSHYINHYEVAVWHSVISDVAEDACNQPDPLLIHIQNEDRFYDLVHKVKSQMDHRKREGGARVEIFAQAQTCSTDSTESDECFISGIVKTQWSPIGNTCETNQPMIAFLYDYRLSKLEYTVQYDRRYLDKVQMYALAWQFQVLLKGVLCGPEKPVLSHPFLTASEGRQFIRWNDTDRAYSKHKTVHQFVEEQAARTPEAVAVEFREQKLSYSELNCRANRIARIIMDAYRAKGQFEQLPTMPITLVMDRSANVLPAMLGVMKAGGAYLPVDPAYPKERIRFILEDAQTKLILTTRQLAAMLKPIIRQISSEEPQLICIDECLAQYGGSDENVNAEVKPSDLAYVIYTSGSTGNPKGALIEHAGLVALIPYLIDKFGLTPNTRVTQFASISFDASVYEWIGTLSVGGTLVVLSDDELPPYADISDILEQKNIHVTMLPPSIIKTMTKRDLPGLRTIVSAGEACTPDLVVDWGGNRLFLNAYGPTEVTIICSVAICKPGTKVTIGRPVSNKRLFVLNPFGHPVPIGVPGELWVGGVGLARGYLNREELTKERFVHKEIVMGDGYTPRIERLYKTGDIVKWTPDGELIYLGRSDDQVKIRGYRIELGEIENQIRNYPGIGQCLVRAWYDGHYQKLAAYYASSVELKEAELIQHLTTVLPSYMIPSYFCRLEVFPLNANGKIDRSALPHPIAMENHSFEKEAEAGEDEMEKRLLHVWRHLLKRQNIGVNDHFYAVGGDSILAIQSVSMARDQGIVFTPRQLADNPSVKELAAVAAWQDGDEPKERDIDWEGEFGITPIQHWFFEQRFEEPNYFNQSHMLVLNHCDAAKLESAVNRLIRLHPELAVQFVRSGNTYVQRYRTDASVEVASYTIREIEDPDPEIAAICTKWHGGLDYESGTMLRVGMIAGHFDGKIRLFLTVHHLVIDGVSWRILLQDLYRLYHGAELPPVQSPFKKWQAAITDYVSKEETARHVVYWTEVLKRTDAFQLPVDHCADNRSCTESAELVATLQPSDTQRLLHKCAHAYHTQINDLMLTAWSLMLSAWSEQETVAFRLEGHGREHCVSDMNLTRSIGWFTSMFPVCIQVSSESSLGKTIKSVKEQLRRIPDHGISYGALRYCHSSEQVRTSLTASEPQALFNYLGQFDLTEAEEEAASEWLNFTSDTAQDHSSSRNHGTSLLELNCSIIQGRLHLFMKYSKRHYEEATIVRLTQTFISYLLSIIEHCEDKEVEEFTPSDFPLASLDQHSLDQIVNMYHSQYGLDQIMPLSPMQKGLLFHYLDHVSSDQYVVQTSWKYNGRLDVGRYRAAWQRVIAENDCLRTCFVWEAMDEPVQCIVQQTELNWTVEDIGSQTLDRRQEYLERWMTLDRERRFDLRQPAYRLALIQNDPEEWAVVWSYHHILLDGWSLPLLLNRVHDIYACSLHAITPKRNPSLSFEPYIRWLISKERTEAEAFWKAYLADVTEPAPLPMDISGKSFEAHQPIRTQQIETLQLDADFTGRIATYVQHTQISLNTLVQFAWGKVLQVLHDVDVTVFGMVVSGRGSDLPQADRITGLLINTLPLVMQWNTDQSVASYVKDLHHTIHKLNDYCYVSLTELKGWSSVQSPTLFQSIVAFENYVNDYRQPASGLNMIAMEEREKTNYPLTITIASDGEQITIKFMYDAERLEQETVRRMTVYLRHALHAAVEHPACAVRDIDLLSEDDYERIVYDWNCTFTEYPRDSSVVELFEEQVRLLSDEPAVITYERVVTYEGLSRLSQHVASLLEEEGLVHGQFIGVCLPRSLELIVSMLGILKAGCVYVPIDPDFPVERMRDMIRDAGLDKIITLRSGANSLTEAGQGTRLKLIYADDFDVVHSMGQEEKGAGPSTASDLAYLMYTSGSTGRPKGVMVEHRSIVRLVKNTNYFPFSQGMRLLYTGSPVFDASTFEIWGTLLNGGRLFVVSKDDLMNLSLLKQQMKAWDINVLWLSAALCNQWIEENVNMFAGLRSLIVGGEALSAKLINRLRLAHPSLTILNGYGPTENTTFSTSYRIERPFERDVPIGKPISNTTCYILNARGGVLPVGAVGEIYVGGDGVARGYWKQEELTREAFVPNPFASAEDRDKGRNLVLYRTGDRGRWLPDGNIEYIGRSDGQLKLRGIRIELGEIEHRLCSFPAVKQSLVLAREVHGELRLIAYYTSDKNEQENELSAYMARFLPSYMLPFRYVWLDSFPLTVNGKVDRRMLPLPEVHPIKQDFESGALTDLEQQIEQIWCHVLKLDSIRKDEDFYALGGHSLHALRMVSMLQKNGHSVTVNQILREQTIERLACSLRGTLSDPTSASAVTSSGQKMYPNNGFPLSAVQRRFFKRDLKNRNMFNVPYLGLLKQRTTNHELNRALQFLVHRHAALRLTFARLDHGEWYQYERELDMDRMFTYVDLREKALSHDTLISEYCSNLQHGFNIEAGPLWKVVLFDHYMGGCGQVLLLLFHHSIFDGMSMNIVLDDLRHLLLSDLGEDDAQGDEIGSSYRDWCETLTQYAASGIPAEAEAYWRDVVEGGRSLQTDRETEEWPLHRHMATITFDLLEGTEQVKQLKAFAAARQTSPLGVLLAVLSRTCFDLKKQSDLLLHLMSYQRESFLPNIAIYRTIGFFAGAYPVRIRIGKQELAGDTEALLGHVKRTLQDIPNEGMDYFALRHIVPELHPEAEPLIDRSRMLFHYQSEETAWQADDFYEPLTLPYGNTNASDNPSAYWLNMTACLKRDRLSLTCYYSTLHYEEQTVVGLVHRFGPHLRQCIEVNTPTTIGEGSFRS
ncbi:non-ribosomal peptide synthase, pvdj(2) [Paenibacillus alvei TS-15]|uniref:Non-ribosomal peptide synthase, pvdj(2) n=1 Tax=Paenibacillus alvei TS-15 TaxID=1117108 RepID=S9SWZ0_PAEAL|nr:non-ribosomal peptide synthetase [Paenibacillus alvei]EPY09154.1 non-ribosomal peptide synthase, pvdj(2) [Paenibacillus alvei TS-15]